MRLLTAQSVVKELRARANPAKAKILAGFFKTGKGQYGEGDTFLGITVPEQRRVALQFKLMPLKEVGTLLTVAVHECRFTALEILVAKFEDALNAHNHILCKKIVQLYCSHTTYINNWDLVDTSASYILGAYVYECNKSRKILYMYARSKDLWKKRIAIVATYYFIVRNEFSDTIKIAEILMHDPHDLIHKAVGWMLREMGKKEKATLVRFLQKHAHHMPRTMLRYSIERFGPTERQKYLNMI
jgi:3-methyladenine DNA glycosylase AlkD